jgi:hypothetical protein
MYLYMTYKIGDALKSETSPIFLLENALSGEKFGQLFNVIKDLLDEAPEKGKSKGRAFEMFPQDGGVR